jgi:cbb3-type cytochrome oxidase subunit 3
MKKTLILILFSIIGLTTLASVTLAAVDDTSLGLVNVPAGIPGAGVTTATQAQEKLIEFVRGLIRVIFLVGGVGVLIFFALGGIRWIFSAGDKQQIDQAKGMITAAVVGFVILALSYLILLLIGTFFKVEIVQKPPPTAPGGSCRLTACTYLGDETTISGLEASRLCTTNYPGCRFDPRGYGPEEYYCCP